MKVGDEVTLLAKVTSVSEGEIACNIGVTVCEPVPGCAAGETYLPSVSCNSKLMQRHRTAEQIAKQSAADVARYEADLKVEAYRTKVYGEAGLNAVAGISTPPKEPVIPPPPPPSDNPAYVPAAEVGTMPNA